ncbi:Csu type fimbrial protein [Sphingopyxis sp.]|uniref:Csu type fimbrial protein n=1 Tax=Sphingopyxis sp. TaxID=1908224 RepID=UPI002FC7C940
MSFARRTVMALHMAGTLEPARRALAALLAVVASGGGLFSPVHAETTAEFDVSATVTSGCLVDGLGDSGHAGNIGTLDFGTDSTFSIATHSASSASNQIIRLRCTPGIALAMSVDGGDHAAAGARHLQLGSDSGARIAYAVCSDAGCTLPITIGGSTSVSITPANSDDVRLPLFATLTLPGALPPGVYSDTLTVTLAW